MKRLRWLCVALLVVSAPVAAAPGNGIDLTWDNCVTDPTPPAPAITKVFPCDGNQTHKLVGCFKVATNMPDFYAMDISIDLQQSNNDPLVPFYHYETGGCNFDGITLNDARNSVPCTPANFATPWGPTGDSPVFTGITAYGPNFQGQNGRGRLLASIARASNSPFPLVATQNYYAFHLEFTDFNAIGGGGAECAGCNTTAAIWWNAATLFGNTETRVLTGPDKKAFYCATINQGIGACPFGNPTRNRTWGQLKSIYR